MGKQKFRGILSGLQEVSPVDTHGKGKIKATFKCDKLIVTGWFKCLSSPLLNIETIGPVHIHQGLPGTNGAVVKILTPTLKHSGKFGFFKKCENTFDLTLEEKEMLKAGNWYVNIHTENYPDGELRSQLVQKESEQFLVVLSGDNEVPPVVTEGSGTVLATLNNNKLVLGGSFHNLSSPLFPVGESSAHIHKGKAGKNGSVVFNLTVVPDEDNLGGVFNRIDNEFCLTCKQVQALCKECYYINIHTEENESGELRGQLVHLFA